MKPILAIYKNSKEFKGILKEKKRKNCGGVRFNKQTGQKYFQNTKQKTEHNTLREVLQCSHPS